MAIPQRPARSHVCICDMHAQLELHTNHPENKEIIRTVYFCAQCRRAPACMRPTMNQLKFPRKCWRGIKDPRVVFLIHMHRWCVHGCPARTAWPRHTMYVPEDYARSLAHPIHHHRACCCSSCACTCTTASALGSLFFKSQLLRPRTMLVHPPSLRRSVGAAALTSCPHHDMQAGGRHPPAICRLCHRSIPVQSQLTLVLSSWPLPLKTHVIISILLSPPAHPCTLASPAGHAAGSGAGQQGW